MNSVERRDPTLRCSDPVAAGLLCFSAEVTGHSRSETPAVSKTACTSAAAHSVCVQHELLERFDDWLMETAAI